MEEREIRSKEETDKLHHRKMIAPVVLSIIIALYYIGFTIVCFCTPIPIGLKLLFGIIPLVLAGVIIYVLAERIHEIRSGEEDDLSQY